LGESPPGSISPLTQTADPLRYPGFPVELSGVGERHAAFLTESRARGYCLVPHSRKSGSAPVS
jgi:hypothetical protein